MYKIITIVILLLLLSCNYPKINEFTIIKKLSITNEDEKNMKDLKAAISE